MEKGIFAIQEHWASHHHFDFRLEKDGVLKSWALPRSFPIHEGEKRLAIAVDDHSLEYADFEGEIVEGYGKGKVALWDRGWYDEEKWGEEEILITVYGNKIKGKYALVKTKGNKYGKSNYNWLVIKRREERK